MSRKLSTTKMERFPSIPESATHSVNSVAKVALRVKPSYFKTERGLDVDTSTKGDVIDILSNGTKLIALDEGTGYQCSWVNVLVVGKNYGNQKLYIHKDNIRTLSTTADSAPQEYDDETGGNPRVPPIVDWTSMEPSVSRFDAHDSKYKVCVELTNYQSTGGDRIVERLEEACRHGLKIIFRDNGKRHDDEFISQYVDDLKEGRIFQFCASEEYFVDIRPNTYLKVLVTLPRKYLIPVEKDSGAATVDGIISSTRWDSLENVVFKSSFRTNVFDETLKKASDVLSTYGKHISKFDGTVSDFDAQFEADNLKKVLSPLNILMRSNNIKPSPFDRDEIIELGWDNTLTLIYVSLKRKSGATIIFTKGLQELADSIPFDSQRTQGYLWNLKEISTIDTSKLTWSDFLFAYTLPSPPTVSPSKKRDSKNFHENIGNVSNNSQPLAKKEAVPYNEVPIKTYTEKLREDRDFGDLEKKFNLYRDRVDAYDFVGDYTASCEGIEKTLNEINTFDDAFEKVLDKVNIADLISQCMGKITSELSNVQDLAQDVTADVSGFGSGLGINDKTDVALDYLSGQSSLPSSASAALEALGASSVESLGVGDYSFEKLGLNRLTAESLGIHNTKLSQIPGLNVEEFFEANPANNTVAIKVTGEQKELPPESTTDATVITDAGGIQNFTLSELGFSSMTVQELGFNELNMSQMGLSGLTFESLGLSSYDISSLSSKIKELGISGASELLDEIGAGKIPGLSTVSDAAKKLGIDDSLTTSIDKATEKLDKLKDFSSDPSAITDMFNQGGSPSLPPSLSMIFSDALPTQDIMADMADTIEFALTTLLNEIFVAMVKNVLKNLNESCADIDGEDEQFGKANLNEMLEDSVPDSSVGQAGPPEAIDTLMNALGMDADTQDPTIQAPAPAGSFSTPRRDEVVSMLDDVSLLLTPVEICSLINGTANRKTLTLVRSFVAKSYPNIRMTKKSQVLRFFRAFGSMIDPSICRIIESPTPAAPSYVVGDVLCRPAAAEADRLREDLLNNKGDNITPDQVAIQLKRARERKANAAKILADFVNEGPLSDGFAPPPVFCQKGSSNNSLTSPDATSTAASKKEKGLVDLSHASIDYMTEKAVDLMFDPVYISFSSDVAEYPSAFVKAPDAADTEDVAGDSAIAISYHGSSNEGDVSIPTGKPKIMPALHSTLRSIETTDEVYGVIDVNDDLETENQYDGLLGGAAGISIDLPTDVVDFSSLSALGSNSSELAEALEQLNQGASTVKWKFNYVEPYQAQNISLIDRPIAYDLYLEEKTASDSKIVFNYGSQDKLSEEVATTLDEDRFNYSPGSLIKSVNLRQHKFASMLLNNINSATTVEFDDNEFHATAKKFYKDINKDVLAYITNLIAASPFFRTIEIQQTIPVPTDPQAEKTPEPRPLHKPVLEYIKLDPEPTLEQRLEGCDPHLLDLKNMKEQLKDDMKNSRCVDLSAPTDGSPAANMSDQEKELIKLCIKTIIRTYMIDFYMRGIFTNSIFLPDVEPDDLYIKSVVQFILNDLDSYDQPNMVMINDEMKPIGEYGTYKEDFLATAYEISDLNRTPEDTGDISTPLTTEGLGEDALVSLIKEQYRSVLYSMKDKINSLMVSDIESRFVLEYIPTANYKNSYYQSTPRDYSGLGEFPRKEVNWSEGTEVEWENGNLFLESYYYLEPHEDTEIDLENPESWSSRGVVSIHDFKQVVEEAEGKLIVDFDNPKEGLYKSVSKGMRLMYSPNNIDKDSINSTTFIDGQEPDSNKIWNHMWTKTSENNNNVYEFSKEKVAVDKCYINFEVSEPPANIASEGEVQRWKWQYKRISSFPVIDSRKTMSEEALKNVTDNTNQLKPEHHLHLLSEHKDFKPLIEYMLPIRRYKTIMEVFCQQATSYDTRINGAMSATKDELRRLFFAINSRGDYRQKDPAMDEIGGPAGLEKMMKNEFGLLDTPASPNSWNYNLPLGWGKSVKGLGFEAVAKATGVAIMKILKRQAEKSDPNISIAYKLAMASKLANLNISTSAWSFMLLPANVFPPLPGPPLGPLGFIYHAMGLGMWLNMDGASGGEKNKEDADLAAAGFASENSCPDDYNYDEFYILVSQEPELMTTPAAGIDITSSTDFDISSLIN